MEPVCNSFAGACFPLVLVLSAAKMPHTRINAATMLNTARRPALRNGMARGFRTPPRGFQRQHLAGVDTLRCYRLIKFLGID
jgi:hypothetical protein